MNRLWRVAAVIVASLFVLGGLLPAATFADIAPGLAFREIEITGDEFIVLQNTGPDSIQHLSDYWLGYVSDDTATATAPPVQQLPDISLASGQVLLLSGGGTIETCDAAFVARLAPTLSNTSGTLALWLQSNGSFTQLTAAQANARWGKSTKTTVLPFGEIDLASETSQYTNPVWYFDATAMQWQLGNFGNCTLTTYTSPTDTTGTAIATWPQNITSPPAVVVEPSHQLTPQAPSIPLADQGLKPPQISELLPNPAGTGNDSTDEFIELYNPNAKTFDLSGFTLQTGTTTKHLFTFDAGTQLPPLSFAAFYASDTGLSLSNGGGQAILIDPLGTVIDQTAVYGSAKDGQAWTLAKGTWYWTASPTPNAANMVTQSGSATASKPPTSTTVSTASVKGAATGSNGDAATTADTAAEVAQVTPIHPWTLALVVALALLYGLYEYRVDVANRVHQFKKYRAARRTGGK